MIELIPLAFIAFYFVPFMVAAGRDHSRAVPILIANLLLGWTVVGWWAVLAWAVFSPTEDERSRVAPIASARHRAAKPRILHHF